MGANEHCPSFLLTASLTPTSEQPTVPLAIALEVYLQPSTFSFTIALSPCGQSLSSFCRLCWRRCCIYTLLHHVLQWFSSQCAETTAYCTDRYSLSSSLWSLSYLYLSFLPILFSVCQLFAAGAFPVSANHLHQQRLPHQELLKVSNNRSSHLRAAMFKKKPEVGVNMHTTLFSATLNFSRALVLLFLQFFLSWMVIFLLHTNASRAPREPACELS